MVLDRTRYSVAAAFGGRAVSVRSTATQIRIVADGTVIAVHARRFGRDQLICDPWHYLPILERKPGVRRNGVPFQEWDWPFAIQLVCERILKQPNGDRAFVALWLMARAAGLEPRHVACERVLAGHVVTASVVMNEMRRLIAPSRPIRRSVPELLKRQLEPLADCGRYDHLRGVSHVIHQAARHRPPGTTECAASVRPGGGRERAAGRRTAPADATTSRAGPADRSRTG